MALEGIILRSFNLGGVAESRYMGTENSLASLVGCDIHSEPGVLKANQKLTKISGSTIDGLCKVAVACSDGNSYWFSSESGKIWKITSAFAVSLVHTTTPEVGDAYCLGALEYKGYIYWATENRLHRIPISGLSNWSTNAEEDWEALNLEQELGTTGDTYTTQTSINEGATHRQTFYPFLSPEESIAVNVDTVGTGNWTVTVHDSSNNSMASKQITNGSMSTGWVIFEFSSAWYPTLGEEYHIHVTSSVADGKVVTATSEDLEDGNLRVYTTGDPTWHPMAIQNQILYIGDKNFVHQVESAEDANGVEVATLTLEVLDIKEPLRIKCLGKIGTDLLLGTYVNDNVNQTEILRWNTWSVSFSVADTIPETGINCFILTDNYVFVNAGLSGNLYVYDGEQLTLARSVPGTYSPTQQGLVHPNASANLKGLPLFGFSNVTGNPAKQGIYSFGTLRAGLPPVLNLEFPISQRDLHSSPSASPSVSPSASVSASPSASVSPSPSPSVSSSPSASVSASPTASPSASASASPSASPSIGSSAEDFIMENVEIGAMLALGSDLLVSWVDDNDTSVYGVDKLDYSNKCDGAYLESRVMEIGVKELEKVQRIIVNYEEMPVNTFLAMQYKKNNGSWIDLVEVNDVDRNQYQAEFEIEAGTLQVRVFLTTNANDSPIIRNILVT